MNILHTLFKDSKLAEFVVPYIGRGFEISIRGFSNKMWPLRNSSTMLFSILMSRMFNNRSNQARQTTDLTFFSLFPNLHPYFLQELKAAVEDEHCLYYPGLYPTLLILQRLTPCALTAGNPTLSLSPFIDTVVQLSRSGVLKTRSLAAETLASIIPAGDMAGFVKRQVEALEQGTKQNHLHGILLQIKQTLCKCSNLEGVLELLVSKSWLLTSNPCPFTSSLYLETVSEVLSQSEAVETADLSLLSNTALRIISSSPRQGPLACLKEACTHFILSLRSPSLTGTILKLGDKDVEAAVFETPGVETWLGAEQVSHLVETSLPAALILLKVSF